MSKDELKTLSDAKLKSKTVIVRANLDVPLENGEVTNNFKLQENVPTIKLLLENNCKIIVIGHIGRPNGDYVDELSLMPVRFELGHLLGKQIKFANLNACENSIKFMEPQEILMIENLRFFPGEESTKSKERQEFIEPLAKMADLYINDCFGLYREHASVTEITEMLPSYAGLSMEKEIEELNKIKNDPQKPLVAVLGGAKVDTKMPILENMLEEIDTIIIGGAMAYTFLKATGKEVGKSKVEEDSIKIVKKILKNAKKNKVEILLPEDHICAKEFKENSEPVHVDSQDIPKDLIGLDIGPKTIEKYKEVLKSAKTVLWNGPMGVFEWENFANGTQEIGDHIALNVPRETFKVAGGGDTVSAINKLKINPKKFSHISVGGGMMLKYISNEKFEVIERLKK